MAASRSREGSVASVCRADSCVIPRNSDRRRRFAGLLPPASRSAGDRKPMLGRAALPRSDLRVDPTVGLFEAFAKRAARSPAQRAPDEPVVGVAAADA